MGNGDRIKLRDAVGNFVKSEAVQEFWRNLQQLYRHMQHHGWWATWSQLVDSLDPFGERNALKVMELEKGASQEEPRRRRRHTRSLCRSSRRTRSSAISRRVGLRPIK